MDASQPLYGWLQPTETLAVIWTSDEVLMYGTQINNMTGAHS